MNIVIADDEPLARSRLRRMLKEIPDCAVVGEACNGEELITLVKQSQPDIALVDIHMPGMDGLNAARKLGELSPPPAVIFTTAFSEHALSAFGTRATGYLLKPIKRDQLQVALISARKSNRAQMLELSTDPPESNAYIEVKERDRIIRVALNTVIFCRAEDKYTRLFWEGGQQLIDPSLRQLESVYPQLLRVHRKVLVSPSFIMGLERHVNGLRLILRGSNEQPPVSRRLAPQVRALLKSG